MIEHRSDGCQAVTKFLGSNQAYVLPSKKNDKK